MPCTKVNTLSQTCGLLSKAPKSSFSVALIRVNAAKFEYSNWIFFVVTKTRAAWGWRAPVFVLSEALACRPGLRVGALIMHDTDRDTDSLSDWGGQGDPAVSVDWRGRDEATLRLSLPPPPTQKKKKKTPPPHPPLAPQGEALGASRPRTSAASWERGGREWAVSSPLFISAGDPRTGSASLFPYIVIKHGLSAQLLPEAKGKSLC